MTLDDNFKLRLVTSLKKNKSFFLSEVIHDMAHVSESISVAAYYFNSNKYSKPSKRDSEILRLDLQKSLDEADYPDFQKNLIYYYSSEQPLFGSAEYEDLRKKCLTQIANIEPDFWADKNTQDLYELISGSFNCFEDEIIDEKGIVALKLKGHVINSAGWIEYYKRMLAYFFPEFEFDVNLSNQTVRWVQKISAGLSLGFEFNESFYKKELDRYRLFLPETRIILINDSFTNAVKEKEYLANLSNNNIIVLGSDFYNPYFPGFFNTLESRFSELKLDNAVLFDLQKRTDRIYVKHNQTIGEQLKRYAFFYFYSVAIFLKPYFRYLILSVNLSFKENLSTEQTSRHIREIKKRNEFLEGEILKIESLLNQHEGKGMLTAALKNVNKGLAMLKKELEDNKIKLSESGN